MDEYVVGEQGAIQFRRRHKNSIERLYSWLIVGLEWNDGCFVRVWRKKVLPAYHLSLKVVFVMNTLVWR